MLGFRVWDIEQNKMYYESIHDEPFVIDMHGKFGICSATTWPEGYLADYDDCIPMQSTGLRDFQGKEIFEGDVLFIYIDTPSLSNHYYLVESVNYFLIRLGALGNSVHKISNDGNIYENPSLLEKIKC